MSDETPLDADIRRGNDATLLLANPALIEAFDKLRADYLVAWEASPARDTDGRERLWQAYQIVGKVRTHLEHVASGGRLARKQVDEVAKLGERQKRFGII